MEMRKLIAGMAAALLAAVLVFPCRALEVSARHGLLLDADTGRVIYEKSADQQALIASTTKIMTALVVCEQTNILDRMRIPKEAVGIEGSSMYLQEGEILTVQELLYGLMLHSGNDAAVALAIYCGGTVEGFCGLMNDKARQLGLSNTHFENPNGLDSPGHYSTARDLAVLTAYALKNPVFAKTVATKTVRVGNRSLRNHNKLLWQYPDATGVKTGYTRAAGRILVSSAQKHGRTLVAVTINAPNDWQDHARLLDHGFTCYKPVKVVSKGEKVGTIPVLGGQEQNADLIADADFVYSLAPDEKVQIRMQKPGFVYAPVVQGQDADFAYVCIGEKVVGKLPLRYGQTVEQEKPEVKKHFWTRWFGGNE